MAIDTIKSSAVLDGAIATADIADDAVTTAKLGSVTDIASSSGAMTLSPAGTEILNVGTTGDILVKGQGGNRAALILRAGANNANSQIRLGDQAADDVGRIMYDHSDDTLRFQTASAERFRVSASGIHIGGTGAANALDDYEEGTWTPTLDFGGGSTGITYGTRSAVYTKIGNVVNFSMRIYLTSKGSSTGHAHVSGFPFTVGGMPTGGVFQLVPARGWLSSNDEPVYIYFANGGTRMAMYYNDWDSSANSAATHGTFYNNTELELTAFYFT